MTWLMGSPKKAVEQHRVARAEVEQWKKSEDDAFHMLKWIGKSVNLASNTETYPYKDNEASRFKANEAKVNKAKIK